MGAILEETIYIGFSAEENTILKENMKKIKELEEEIKKLKEEIVKYYEQKYLKELQEELPNINISDLKIYQVYVEVEKTIEDFKIVVLTINGTDYAVVFESYCEYIDPDYEIKHFGKDLELEYPEIAEKVKDILEDRFFNVIREVRIIY